MRVERDRIWLFVGIPKTGKSTAAKLWVAELLQQAPDAIAIIHDPHGDGHGGSGFPGRQWESVGEFRKARKWDRRNVFRGPDVDPEELATLAVAIGETDDTKGGRPVILVLDELDLVLDRSDPSEAMTRILQYGRWCRVALIGTTRRPSTIGTDVPSLAEGLFLYHIGGHTDLEWVRQVTSPYVRDLVRELPRFQGVYFHGFEGPCLVTAAGDRLVFTPLPPLVP